MNTHIKPTWEKISQPFERNWWLTHEFPGKEQVIEANRAMWDNFGLGNGALYGESVIDVGCGPTGRFEGMETGPLIAIDPLFDFYKTLPTANMGRYMLGFSHPAEVNIPALTGWADMVVSINALDHGYDLGASLWNIKSYMKPDGVAFISFDCGPENGDKTHPIHVTQDEARAFILRDGFTILRETSGHCFPQPDGTWQECWGQGLACHWVLRKNTSTKRSVAE